ncbi:hypothetical protein QJS10_CPB20g00125 [Acorus calamus]|uniref:Uncharacterized protein n=1 Tax=Acorus calamus TaxID=4465 RepID=A0AAV9CD70_ACOCL|nr:hypothetical protein QJS10_CPB20g00125 [Acorus calamus]
MDVAPTADQEEVHDMDGPTWPTTMIVIHYASPTDAHLVLQPYQSTASSNIYVIKDRYSTKSEASKNPNWGQLCEQVAAQTGKLGQEI